MQRTIKAAQTKKKKDPAQFGFQSIKNPNHGLFLPSIGVPTDVAQTLDLKPIFSPISTLTKQIRLFRILV